MMPYNTRRKSLSLADLGVIVPKRSRAVSHPSPPSTIVEGDESERPKKMSKTTHRPTSPPHGSMSPPRTTTIRSKLAQELSPPPSPAAEGSNRVDVEGINDDIVIGTIRQLEQTGNRPILVRELAAILATTHHSVEKSANPSALISSRLTSYLNRQWPAISPCPLAKDLSPMHPRRLYFFLTTMPRQPIPDTVEQSPKPNRIISPSLSSASAADEEDERYNRSRQALSPSPEVDLSSPELEDEASQQPPTPGAPFSGRNSVARERSTSESNLARGRRASPQLENEERDFKQTANAVYEETQKRRNSQPNTQQDVDMDQADTSAGAEQEEMDVVAIPTGESEESVALKNSEAAAALFGATDHLKVEQHMQWFNSPLIEAQNALRISMVTAESNGMEKIDEPMEHLTLDLSTQQVQKEHDILLSDWSDVLQSPENVELAELEDLFDAY